MKRFAIEPRLAWIRSNYEKAVLVIAVIFLSISTGAVVRNRLRFETDYSCSPSPTQKAAPPSSKTSEIEAALVALRQPAQWTFEGPSGLFVPEKHFINADGFPAALRTTQVHPPIPNQWFVDFKLPITDADVLNQDPDDDGFSNLEEWKSQTNPIENGSHPPFASQLWLKALEEDAFRVVFTSRTGNTFAINTNDLKEPTQFLKLGDVIRGTKFRLAGFQKRWETNQYGTRVDVSTLTLENEETWERKDLIKEQVVLFPEVVARFVYLWRGRFEFAVMKGQHFSLNPETQIKYQLINAAPGKAVISTVQTPNELIEVRSLNP